MWEYLCVKVLCPPISVFSFLFRDQYTDLPAKHTELLNQLGAQGWEWIHAERDLFYFRRRKQLSKEKLQPILTEAWKADLPDSEVYLPGFAVPVNPNDFLLPGMEP